MESIKISKKGKAFKYRRRSIRWLFSKLSQKSLRNLPILKRISNYNNGLRALEGMKNNPRIKLNKKKNAFRVLKKIIMKIMQLAHPHLIRLLLVLITIKSLVKTQGIRARSIVWSH